MAGCAVVRTGDSVAGSEYAAPSKARRLIRTDKEVVMRLHQFVCLLTFTCASLSAYARIEGEVSRDSFWVGECEVADMAIRYRVGVESGEPLVGSSLRWKSGPKTF